MHGSRQEVLAVIPARGGSKGIPGKNIVGLGGKPLINWTIEAALKSTSISRTLVSTDSSEIATVAKASGAETPFIRPAELGADDVHAFHAVKHAVDWLQRHENYQPDIVFMLLPTSPLRTHEDIDAATALLIESGAPAVIGVCAASVLASLRTISEGRLKNVARRPHKNYQRQEVDPLYACNGAIFAAGREELLRHGEFHIDRAVAYVMPKTRSIDINTEDELSLAEILILGDRTSSGTKTNSGS